MLRGIVASRNCELTVVANVGDNIWVHGLYVCPDLDTAMYTLAGIANKKRGWGIEGDTFRTLSRLSDLGEPAWFKLGDKDLATHIIRTEMLTAGATLTDVTRRLCQGLQVKEMVLPATDNHIETHILSDGGEMHLQEFWVERKGKADVQGVKYVGLKDAKPSASVQEAIRTAHLVVVCPANPVTSIGPIVHLPGFERLLANTSAKTVAVSPMRGPVPFSGPAGKLLKSLGARQDSIGVASLYSRFIDDIIIDDCDCQMKSAIQDLGIGCRCTNTEMKDARDEIRLAREVLAT
jgi:LPPG:FO 2-phospho-L-lactate transferase